MLTLKNISFSIYRSYFQYSYFLSTYLPLQFLINKNNFFSTQMLTDLVACSSRGPGVSTSSARTSSSTGGNGVGTGVGEEEELLLNSVAACTNITFYSCKVRTVYIEYYVQFMRSVCTVYIISQLCQHIVI